MLIIQYVPVEIIKKFADALECKPEDLTEDDYRYSQNKKKSTTHSISSEEYALILNYRQLPDSARQAVKEICKWQISSN